MNHTFPRRLGRYGYPGFLGLQQWSPRQRYILEASLARFRERHGEPPPMLRGEVGDWFGIRIIPNASIMGADYGLKLEPALERIEPWLTPQPDQAEVHKLLVEDAMLTGTMMYRLDPDGTIIRIPPLSARR